MAPVSFFFLFFSLLLLEVDCGLHDWDEKIIRFAARKGMRMRERWTELTDYTYAYLPHRRQRHK